jgi:hypothetical protein
LFITKAGVDSTGCGAGDSTEAEAICGDDTCVGTGIVEIPVSTALPQ